MKKEEMNDKLESRRWLGANDLINKAVEEQKEREEREKNDNDTYADR